MQERDQKAEIENTVFFSNNLAQIFSEYTSCPLVNICPALFCVLRENTSAGKRPKKQIEIESTKTFFLLNIVGSNNTGSKSSSPVCVKGKNPPQLVTERSQ